MEYEYEEELVQCYRKIIGSYQISPECAELQLHEILRRIMRRSVRTDRSLPGIPDTARTGGS